MNNEYYDLQHLKAIPIAEYLHTTYGVEPAKRYNGYALYHAPYREDFNASMKVDFRENLWHDYGTGQGGSIIDLVMRMQGCSAYEAMKHLAGKRETIVAPSSFHREDHIEHRRDEQRANNRTFFGLALLLYPETGMPRALTHRPYSENEVCAPRLHTSPLQTD